MFLNQKKDLQNFLVDAGVNVLSKRVRNKHSSIADSGVTLINNEIKDIVKVIRSLENTGILFKGTTRKISSQKGGFINFLKPLISVVLSLIRNVLAPLA